MANILVNIEKGIEIGAEDVLKWLTGAEKVLFAAPKVIAALAILAAAMEKRRTRSTFLWISRQRPI